MSKRRSGGLLTLLTGVALGAAGLFFSDKKNRTKAKRVATKTANRARKLQKDWETNPDKVMSSAKRKAKKVATKTAKKAVKAYKKASRTAKAKKAKTRK